MSKEVRPPRRSGARSKSNGLAALWVLLGLLVLCGLSFVSGTVWLSNQASEFFQETGAENPAAWSADSAELTVAVSPVMAPLFQELADQFNAQAQQTPDGQTMTVRVLPFEPEKMVEAALDAPEFQAMSPDSSLWLDRLEQQWTARTGESTDNAQMPIGQRRIGEQVRYAVSPIVIAAWESAARELGWPEQPVGWQDIQRQATRNPDFKWNHPATSNAAGMLATLAEFYAGAGLTRGLTAEAATAPETIDYVKAVEGTVRFYGEGEDVIVQRLAAEGRDFLDAFVGQERVVIDWNQQRRGERLVAIYPAEGTLWTDHPLALLELGAGAAEAQVTDNQRLTYKALAAYLTSKPVQEQLLQAGYRPADLNIPLDGPGSPFATDGAVDWRQPQTTLQMPPPAVVDVVRDFWYYAKRPTNVFLVVDTSGSMEGGKIDRTREALTAFVSQIKGDRDRVGLVEFGSQIKDYLPLQPMDDANRSTLLARIARLEAGGGTALIDGAYESVAALINEDDAEAINAIVIMTDGQENESWRNLGDLRELLRVADNPPVIFTIGFGADADEPLLRAMAEVGGGQYRRADETDIEELYKVISTYF